MTTYKLEFISHFSIFLYIIITIHFYYLFRYLTRILQQNLSSSLMEQTEKQADQSKKFRRTPKREDNRGQNVK